MDPRYEKTISQQFREVSIETTIEDDSGYHHPVVLRYSLWEDIVSDYSVRFIYERKFDGFQYLADSVKETIKALEGVYHLDFVSQITIE